MNDRETLKLALENICGAKLCEINSMSSRKEMLRLMDEAIAALRQTLDHVADTTKMIEPSMGIVGWMYEDQLPEIYPYEAMLQFSVVDGVRMFPVYAPKAEPDMGIDRGAWSDVPDATKWVDELRGGDETEQEWQGLTDEDIAEGAKQSWVDKQAFESAVWWAEEKLKEKNRG